MITSTGEFTVAAPDGPVTCLCVAVHHPTPTSLDAHHIWPEGHGGPTVAANLVWLCPTAHRNVHELLDAWHRAGQQRPIGHSGNRWVYELAAAGWQSITESRVVGVPARPPRRTGPRL